MGGLTKAGAAGVRAAPAGTGGAAVPAAGRAARAAVGELAALVAGAQELLAAPGRLRERAGNQLEQLHRRAAASGVRRVPIAELRSLAGRNARLDRLEEAGFRTVADVLDATPHELRGVPGVGQHTVRRVTAAARRLAAEQDDPTRLRLDPDRRPPAQTELLATLAAIRSADAVPTGLRNALSAFVAEVQPLLAAARPATGRLRMALSGPARRQAALAALARLEVIRQERRVAALRRAVDRYGPGSRADRPAADRQRADRQSADRLWAEYQANAAAVNTLLAELVAAQRPGGRRAEADGAGGAAGAVPPELRQRITALPLDTSLLTSRLRRYQVFGAQYAIHQERSMLGDEMGLGKTVQALAVLAHLAARGQRRFLVVCPASVLVNWLREIARHTKLTAHALHGGGRDEAARAWLRAGGVAVTTFGTLGRLPRRVRAAEVAMLVVDEAHYVKNPKSGRSRVVAEVAGLAQRALFLTGTPMENRVAEFRALVAHLQPWVAEDVGQGAGAGAGAAAFRRAVAPVYLRRNQEDVLDELPEKIEVEDWVQLTPRDEAHYLAAVRARNLMAMRQAAFASDRSAKLERLVEIVEEAAQERRKVVVFSFFLDVLAAVEHRLQANAGAPRLTRRALGRPRGGDGSHRTVVGSITGAVPPAARQRMIEDFTRRPGHAVLLAQIEAGGVGLNIQAASVVVITEPQWKPGTEDQAVARAHRMGQVRRVQVHRLLAKDGVDERIRELQQGKRLLFDAYARRSDAKDTDRRAIDPALDDPSIPATTRVVLAEERRLAGGR